MPFFAPATLKGLTLQKVGPVRAGCIFVAFPWVAPTATHGLPLRGRLPLIATMVRARDFDVTVVIRLQDLT